MKNKVEIRNKGLVFAGLGMEVIGMMVGSVIFGAEIDKYYGWPGYAVMLLVIASFIVWVVHVVVISKRFMREHE